MYITDAPLSLSMIASMVTGAVLLLGAVGWWLVERLRPFWGEAWLGFAGTRALNRLGSVLAPLLNWVFVYGNLGSPPLYASGSAIATAISR